MKKTIIATLLIFASITFNAYAEEFKNESNAVNAINYNNIESTILERNTAVKINRNTLDSLQINYKNLLESEEDLKDGIRGLESLLRMYKQQRDSISFDDASEDDGVNSALSDIEQILQGIFSANIATLLGNISAMETQLENLHKQQEDMFTTIDKMALNGEMVNNQMVFAGENLIFVYYAIDEQKENIDKNIAMIQDQLRILKIQESLGNIPSMDIEGVELTIEELNSTKEALDNQKLNIKRQLNLLLGQSYNTPLEIAFTPTLDIYTISSMNNKEDLNTAVENSYELRLQKYEIDAKQVALERAKIDEDDGENSNKYKLANIDLENERLKFEDAKRNYELKFQQLYDLVKDKQKALNLENRKLAQEKNKMEVAKKKYDLGLVSKKDYDDAKSYYDLELIKVETAKSDLFTAYRKYEWMLKGLNVQ